MTKKVGSWGRAETLEDKELLLERLLEAWNEVPSLRLGQLVYCAHAHMPEPKSADMFYTEDDELIAAIEKLAHLGE
jgi:hypothetical protein